MVHSTATVASTASPIGSALAQAREAAGWTVEDVSHELKLSLATVVALEKEEFAAAGAPVYVRGFVRSYAKLMGFDEHAFDAALAARYAASESPTLTPSHGTRRSVNWGERYSWAFSYLVGTALVLTLIWTIIGFDSDSQRQIAAVPPPAAPVQPGPASSAASTERTDGLLAAGMEAASDRSELTDDSARLIDTPTPPAPVMASMAPFSTAAAAPDPDSRSLALDLAGTSWVEVYDRHSQRVAFGTLPPGLHQFVGEPPLLVLLGNATGATVRVGGQRVDFGPFLRANVARFRVVDGDAGVVAEAAALR